MSFASFAFGVFLIAVLLVHHVAGRRWQNLVLLAASYFFYAWWDWRFLALLAAATWVDFHLARLLSARTGPSRKRLMWASVGLNLASLGLFKYFNFFVASAQALLARLGVHGEPVVLQLVLPLGISFFTFQSISYVVDVYRGSREPTHDLGAYALYMAYFPHLFAGPIQRSTQLLPQLLVPRTTTWSQVESAAVLLLMGYFKKIAISDAVAPTVTAIFDTHATATRGTLLIGIYLFALQIYCDFSGYTDIARGVSRLFGIELGLNFRQPYLSVGIKEFWRRWHISLSTWLRDYLYIPLGGNRHGQLRTYRNLMVTMLLGGLWHGAAWTFVTWGAIHGVWLCLARGKGPRRRPATRAAVVLSTVVTFHLLCLTWIPFRAPTLAAAWSYLQGLVTRSGPVPLAHLFTAAAYLPWLLLLDLPALWTRQEHPIPARWPIWAKGVVYGIAIIFTCWIGAADGQPFIYFQF